MQQRRLRPGDVLDDYCPRERRVTDHAIVAMIDDQIKQTRCVSCDTEHEYKQARVPPQRRKKASAALFTQVLDGLQGSARLAQSAASGTASDDDVDEEELRAVDTPDDSPEPSVPVQAQANEPAEPAEPTSDERATEDQRDGDDQRGAEEGPVRRPLIRAQLPRHEGQQPPARELPDFTIRQPTSARTNRPGGSGSRPGGGRRRGGGHQQGQGGTTRFGGGQGRSNQFGRSSDRRHGGRQGQGPGQGHDQGHGGRPNRGGGRRGGGKKH